MKDPDEPTPEAWKSDFHDLLARAAEAAARAGITPREAMTGADFVFTVHWHDVRGERFPSYLDYTKLGMEGDIDAR